MGTGVIIAALPAVDERVNRLSSEKAAHMTLLFLGENPDNLDAILEYVEHAAKELSPFYMPVDYRGTLGPDDADVLFFEDNRWDADRIKEFRHHLLLNDAIKKAYDSQDQYPEWTPHLTMGYPETPAHEDTSDYPGIHGVQFDRITVWTGDSEGPEFRLKYAEVMAQDVSVAMSTEEVGAMAAAHIFGAPEDAEHHGVKGMKWGVRHDPGHEGEKVKTKKLDKLDAKWQKQIYTTQGAVKVHNAMADHFNARIEAVNAKHPDADYRKGEDTPEWKAYMADVNKLQSESYSHAVETVHGSSPSGKKQAYYYNDGKGNERIEIKDANVKHAADEEVETDLTLMARTDEQGRILELNEAELAMNHSENSDALMHYGVKGMRWGVRKDEAASRGGASKGPTAVVVTQKKPGTFAKTEGGSRHPLHEDAAGPLAIRQKAKSSTTDSLSNAELKAAIDRMQLEQRYAQLEFSSDRRSRGQRFLAGLFGQKKPTKFKDMDEEYGEKARKQVAAALAARAAAKAATAGAA